MNQIPLFSTPSLSVTELTRYLRTLIDGDEVLQDVWVQGEVSNFSQPNSGHQYFTLKDSGASLRCVVWRSTAQRLHFGIQNGLAIEAHGAISVYERDGAYQLYVDAIRPAGEGFLYQQFIRLKNRLESEGLFAPERKRPIPERPECIGIVTSSTAAALQDMLNTLRARYPLVKVILSPCSVQGETAPAEIVAALNNLCTQATPDVIIVARGGGSLEDLWAFNDERVVRAIAESPIPVITGIGHETDFTLADFAADMRAPTPTGAAVLATPNRTDLLTEIYNLQSRLENAVLQVVSHHRQELGLVYQRLEHASPARRIQDELQGIDKAQERLWRGIQHNLQLQRAHLNGLYSRLLALNPDSILQRGFAFVQRADGSLLHSVMDVQTGEQVDIRLRDGTISSRVERIHPHSASGAESSSSPE